MNKPKAVSRILLVDDHPMIRDGMTMRISEFRDLQVCGEAESEEEAFELAGQTKPDLMIIDIALKSGNGIELVKRVASRYPQVKMLVMSGFVDSLYAERALRAGALGYLNKQESNNKIFDAIRAVLNGERFVSQEIAQRLMTQAMGKDCTAKTPLELLSNREIEVFRMIGQGLTSGVIAERLFLSSHTIDTHRENIKRKLGLKNAAELNHQAIEWVLENQ